MAREVRVVRSRMVEGKIRYSRILRLKPGARVRDLPAVGKSGDPVEWHVVPDTKELEAWSMDGVCETPDGCRVEPDGECEHGHESWLLVVGVI